VKRTGAKVDHESRPRRLLRRAAKGVSADCPCEEMNAEDPLFILYTSGSTGKPKGVLHTTGGYARLHLDDASICVRLSRRRRLLVHRRRGLGHRPQLHRLWPAAERRHHPDVRGRAELPDQFAVLGSDRQAQGQYLLHRADRDPRADAGRRRSGEEDLARLRCGCSVRSASRSIRKRGNGITAWSATAAARSSIPGGRPRPAAFSSPRCPARSRRSPARRRCRSSACKPEIVDAEGKVLEGATTGNLCIADSWPGQMRTVYGDHQRFVDTYFRTYQGQVFHRRRLPARRGRLLLDHRPGRRRDQRVGPPHGHGGSRIRAGRASEGVGSRRGRISASHQGPGHLCLCHADGGRDPERRPARRNWSPGSARRSAPSPRRTCCNSRRACRKPAPARSCAASCARSPRTISPTSATPPRSPIRWWSTIWSPTGRTCLLPCFSRRRANRFQLRCIDATQPDINFHGLLRPRLRCDQNRIAIDDAKNLCSHGSRYCRSFAGFGGMHGKRHGGHHQYAQGQW
jgi:hypothetical protein